MKNLNYLLLLLMVISFVLASLNVAFKRVNFVAVGLLCFALTLFIPLTHILN